jgi:HD-GYP domain-containing protein (c-di-GMP phosphodiesterase class II)
MLSAFAQALEERDAYARGHSLRVTELVEVVGRRLGWDEARIGTLRLGALLHDVGKLTLPHSLLRKPGPLDAREVALVRLHPVVGAQIVTPVIHRKVALDCVLYHHEHWDGHGYPLGRRGLGIPETARLLSVADAFDAMTSTRPYRAALSPDAAIAELDRCSGTQFDPQLAASFVEAWDAGELPFALEHTAA